MTTQRRMILRQVRDWRGTTDINIEVRLLMQGEADASWVKRVVEGMVRDGVLTCCRNTSALHVVGSRV